MLVYQRVNHTYHTETGWSRYFFFETFWYHPFWWTWLVLPSHVQVDQPTFPTWPHMGQSIPIPYAPNVHTGKWPNGHQKWMVWRSKTDDRLLVTDPMFESYPNNKWVSSSFQSTLPLGCIPKSWAISISTWISSWKHSDHPQQNWRMTSPNSSNLWLSGGSIGRRRPASHNAAAGGGNLEGFL